MDNLFQQNKKCILTKEKQQLLLPFVAFEKKIAELYSLMKKKQHYTGHLLLEIVKLKRKLKKYIIIFLLALTMLLIFIYKLI